MSIYQAGQKYGIDYRDEFGRRRRMLVGSKEAAEATFRNISESAAQARRTLRTMSRAETTTTKQAIEEYMATRALEPERRSRVRKALEKACERLGNPKTSDLTPGLLARYAESRRATISQQTAAEENGHIKRFGAWLAEQWYTPSNPAAALSTKQSRRSSGQAITHEQEEKLLSECRVGNTRVKALLALDAGLRISEAMALKRNAWNHEERTLTVWSTKTRSFRTIPATERLQAQLEKIASHLSPDARITSGVQTRQAGAAWLARHRRLGAAPRYHDLRHTFASKLAAVAAPHVVRALLGHAPRTTTDLYTHPSLEECRNAIGAMEAANHTTAAEPKPAKPPQPNQYTKSEEAMPGKRYRFKVRGEKYGHLNLNRVRPTEDQTGVAPGNLLVERQNDCTHYTVALTDLEEIEQPTTEPKGEPKA